MEPNDPRDPEFKAAIHQAIERYLQALNRQALLQTRDLFLSEFTYKTVHGEILSPPSAYLALQEIWGSPSASISEAGIAGYTLEGLWVTQGQAFAEITLNTRRQPDIQPDEMDPSAPITIVQRLVFHQDGGAWKLHTIEEMGQGLYSTNPGTSRPI